MMKRQTNSARRNLVILRAGDKSLHPDWIASPRRDFDILVSYYGAQTDLHADTADLYEMRRGPKWSCIADLLREQPELVEQYDAFWFPDDDLASDTDNINRMFAFFHAFRLSLAQPALTADSFFSWKNLLQDPGQFMRFTSFVEVMAPLFDRSTLQLCLPSFGESRSGWGLDWVWGHLCEQAQRSMAIIDATPVKHTRPVASGGDLYKNNPELDPKLDRERLVAKYGLITSVELGKYAPDLGGVVRRGPDKVENIKKLIKRTNAARKLKPRR
jgi:hypothetical protein